MSQDLPDAYPRFGLLAPLLVVFAVLLGCEGNAATQPPTDESKGDAHGHRPSAGGRDATDQDEVPQANGQHPFPHRIKAPEFPRDMAWLNTSGALRLRDLKGKFVLLDFWTYCCINCIHILPELKKLERAYPNELVVIGVHSAKFDTEKVSENIAEAILRYEIEHPVVNDSEHAIWRSYGISSWPSLRVIDPDGNLVAGHGGEIRFAQLDAFFKHTLPYYQKKGTLDASPVRFDLLAGHAKPTSLRFPGKVLADEAGKRLFISDCNNNRIVITSLSGKLLDIVGTGAIGMQDGGFDTATFHHPQGMALHGTELYVADTENHVVRKVDLEVQSVTRIAGTGVQARNAWPGLDGLSPVDPLPKRWVGKPIRTALNSPWALWVDKSMDDNTMLYIAMAGPHQIWKMPLDESEIGPHAGNGREDIVDGPLLPQRPYELGFSSFAQPSGLTSDGTWLYVADSEGSSIRAVPFDPAGRVKTVVGTNNLEFGRLFEFGDVDGPRESVKMQHCLGVVYLAGKIYVADTYNNKIKVVDAETGETRTLAGTGVAGNDDEIVTFDEPAGVSYALGKLYVADTNNHAIRTVDIQTGKVTTLDIAGLDPPPLARVDSKPTFPGATRLQVPKAVVKPVDGTVRLRVSLKLPDDWKINNIAPMSYLLEANGNVTAIDPTQLAASLILVAPPAAEFDVLVPVTGDGEAPITLSLNYYYCRSGGEGICKVGSVAWAVPLAVRGDAADSELLLSHKVEP